MKKFTLLLFSLCYLLFSSCNSHQELKMPGHGQVVFSLNEEEVLSGGRKQATPVPAFARYTLSKSNGTLISEQIELISFNDTFVSSPVTIDVGDYQLKEYFILDATGQVIYASPLTGSPLAYLVTHPLPLDFTVQTDQVTTLNPEVLLVADMMPETFGYVRFGLNVVEYYTLSVAATIGDEATHESIDYELEVIAKDAPLGTIQWQKTFTMSKTAILKIPAGYGHYTFKANKDGYLPHEQHFQATLLSNYHALAFEFIPESLEGFSVTKSTDNTYTVYFPTDQNRCKLYARFDLAEGYVLEYFYADKQATTKTQRPVSPIVSSECFIEESVTGCWKAVNLFDNLPFGKAADFCLEIDLTNSSAHSLDDVNIYMYVGISYRKYGETEYRSGGGARVFKGLNNQ